MAFDGIITRGIVAELKRELVKGKVDRVNQPIREELVLTVHTQTGNKRLFASSSGSEARLHLIDENPANPPVPFGFCMLLRKHLVGGRIVDIRQKDSERIIEMDFETTSELGFTLSRRLVFEIMGKHSNIILVDLESGNIIDSIKHVSIDTSRARQVLPGMKYAYPPEQEKTPFDRISPQELAALPDDSKAILSYLGGIAPGVASALADMEGAARYTWLQEVLKAAESDAIDADSPFAPHIYVSSEDKPVDFHIAPLGEYEDSCKRRNYPSLSPCIADYFKFRNSSGRFRQQSNQLTKNTAALLEKAQLKLQRLSEDLAAAEDSEHLRIYGEILTANIHQIEKGASQVTLDNYYDGSKITIPLDPRHSPSKNAQQYFKRYGKAKTAIKELGSRIETTQSDIDYLSSCLAHLENLTRPEDIEDIRRELVEEGYLRPSKTKDGKRAKAKNTKPKANPYKFTSPSGFEVLVGRNNKENDLLTFGTADKTDLWLHTKDIHGSHVIMRTGGAEVGEEDIYFAAAVAAWYSKARESSNVPVDYVPVRYVKKPAGAKPGMVIFTNNRTVYIDPKIP